MKRTVVILLVVAMLLSTVAFAAEMRAQPATLSLSFDGTTANCEVTATASNMNQSISATIKLYRGNTWLHTWTVSDTGYLEFSETWPVTSGYTYKLTADLTINGTTYPTVSTTRTCN